MERHDPYIALTYRVYQILKARKITMTNKEGTSASDQAHQSPSLNKYQIFFLIL